MVINKKQPEPKKEEKKKHYWWKYLLCIFSGFILCIGTIAGGLVIATSAVKTGDLIKMTGNKPEDVLTEEYRNQSLFQLITSLASGQVSFESLDGIAKLTPMVDSLLASINDTIEENLHFRFDEEQFKNLKYDEIPQFIFDAIFDNVTIAKMVGVSEDSSKIMKYFLLHQNPDGSFDFDHPYTIREFTEAGFVDNLLSGAKLSDLFDTSDSKVMEALGDLTLSDLENQDKIMEKLESIKISDIMSEEDINANPLLTALANKTIGDLKDPDTIKNLKISELLSAEDIAGSKLLEALKDKTIDDLTKQETVESIKLSDILDTSTSPILTALSEKTIGDLKDPNTIKNLKIEELFSAEDLAGSKLLTALKDKTIDDLTKQETIENLKLNQILSDDDIANSTLLSSLADKTISELADDDTINNLTILELFGEDAVNGSRLLTAIKDNTFADLKDDATIKALTLYDIFGDDVNNSPIMKALKDSTIDSLTDPATIEGLKISELFSQDDIDGSTLLTALKNKTIADLKDDDTIRALTLYDFFGDDVNDSPILKALKDNPISSLTDPATIEGLTISQLFNADEIAGSNLLTALKDFTVADLKDDNTIKSLGLDAIFSASDIASSKVLTALYNAGATLGNIHTAIDDLELQDVIDLGTSPSQVMITLSTVKISDLGNKINNLTFQDVIEAPGASAPQIVKTLYNENVLISNITTRLSSLTLGDVFSTDDLNDNFVLKHIPATTSINGLGTAVNNLKIVEVFENDIYKHDGTGALIEPLEYENVMWKYLLHESDEDLDDPVVKGNNYTIASDMGQMIQNMQDNVQRAKIRELVADDLITLNPAYLANLNERLKVSRNVPPLGVQTIYLDAGTPYEGLLLGDYTITGLLDLLASIAA